MKQMMIDMMAAMMPYMRPLALVAAAIWALGLVFALVGGRGGALTRLAGRIALAAAIFFLGCEAAGRVLGFEPTILFAAPMDRVLYRNQWPFWTIGLGFIVLYLLLRPLSRAR